MPMGWPPWTLLLMLPPVQSYEPDPDPMPVMVPDALVGGVGNVWARSRLGRPAEGLGAIEAGC